ncbi:tRNA A64-2'-O-ribosylphosphate transferase [Blastocladiella britannica]|nr:tRNA A64-2'-O-ribosylphosphate transferase [Blastocladiella britannica]
MKDTLSQQLRKLKRHTHQPFHILKSIARDAAWVATVAEELAFPLISNLRCGRWYVDPNLAHDSCYFKSTDGHYGKWDVPTRRLNLHMLAVLEQHQGIIIVDSTRKGKRFPDALSRTVPLWCAAMNAFLFPDRSVLSDAQLVHLPLCTLPSLVSASEASSMQAVLDHQVLPRLRSVQLRALPAVAKPLRCIWISPDMAVQRVDPSELDFTPIYCVTASRVINDASIIREEGFVYVQGGADDEENWALGLTPELFWSNTDALLASATSCDAFLDALRTNQDRPIDLGVNSESGSHVARLPGTPLFVGSRGAARPSELPWSTYTHGINCTDLEHLPLDEYLAPLRQELAPTEQLSSRYLCLQVPEGKKGAAALEASFSVAIQWAEREIVPLGDSARVFVHCDQGRDRSVCVALALILSLWPHALDNHAPATPLTKDAIRNALLWMTSHYPRALPSRASLKRLNCHFLDAPSG